MTTRKKVWIGIGVFTVLSILSIVYSLGVVVARLDRVNIGLAWPEFPYSDYTQEELEKLYPQENVRPAVPTVRTPEETHKIFIEKLKAGDIDGAVECCFVEGDQSYMKEGLNMMKSEERLEAGIAKIENIEKSTISMDKPRESSYEYMTSYKGLEFASSIRFKQNNEGIWLMERF